MNKPIKNILCTGVIAAAGAAAMLSCSDTWDDHYSGTATTVFSGTTMQAIEAETPDFAEVIKAVGFDRELQSENVYTIWAPANFDKEAMLALARTDSARVVDRFIKNHIARYYVSQDGREDRRVSLMSSKLTTMTADGKFGSANMDLTRINLSCENGILHVIDSSIPYQYNVFEQIEALYNAKTDSVSMYAFLSKWNADSLDADKSVSRGVDENGERIWVDSVMIRNNTALKNMKALIYREDSNYIAIVPSAEAYKERYNVAKGLLVFNPSENVGQEEGRDMDVTDSLQNYYANLFAMADLFYNRTDNEHWTDSLKSTQYSTFNWPNHIYYSHVPATGMHPDKEVNDILAKSGSPVKCSNGEVYVVDEYPMTPEEQFFYKLYVEANTRSIVSKETDDGRYSRNIGEVVYEAGNYDKAMINEEGDTVGYTSYPYHFLDIPTSGSFNIEAGFEVPNTLAGKYDLYIVTCPIWAKNYGFREGKTMEDDARPYKFQVTMFERANNPGKPATLGLYPASGERLKNPETGANYFVTDPTNEVDTLYLGEFTFSNAYYGRAKEGVIIKVASNVSSTEERRGTYTREMLISGFIFRPKLEAVAEDVTEEAKRK